MGLPKTPPALIELPMRKGIGVSCIILGVLLIVKGHDVGNSLASHLRIAIVGTPVDEAMRLYLLGIGLGLFGLLLIFWKGK
jgi:drug/metabolite transporter (DMT)-like permease